MQSSNGHYSMYQQVHMVLTTLSLSKYCLLRVCNNTMGSCWRKDILTLVLPSLFCNMVYQGVWFPSPYELEIDGPKVLLFGTMV